MVQQLEEESKGETAGTEVAKAALEESKAELSQVVETVMIDTTGGAKAKAEEMAEESKEEPSPSNEAKSGVQRALNMTDELNNHATLVLEQHDADQNEPNQEDL